MVYRGNPEAHIMIVGQAPGREEVKVGKPFVGPAGKELDKALTSVGLTEEEVYITNPVKVWPPGDRAPSQEELSHGREHLDWEIEHVHPNIIIPLGAVATRLFTDSPWGISRLSGQLRDDKVFPIIHPAAILHNPANRPLWEQSWRNLAKLLSQRGLAEQGEAEPKDEVWGPEQLFTHLHNHSEYSKLDGHQTLDEMMRECRRKGYRAIALTDHGTLAGWMAFYRAAKAAGIKPILGLEAYIAEKRSSRNFTHLVLLALNLDGYRSLIQVQTRANLERQVKKPLITWEDLKDLRGVAALTACTSGVFGKPVLHGDKDQANRNLERLIELFTASNVFLEVQPHPGWEPQLILNNVAIEAAKRYNLKLIATNDNHYAQPDGWAYQDVMMAIRDHVHIDYPGRMRYDIHDLHLKDAQAVHEGLVGSGLTPEQATAAMTNAVELGASCTVDVPRGTNVLPVPPTEGDRVKAFERLAWEGLAQRKPDFNDIYRKRMAYELELYKLKNFVDYMLIVYELVSWAKHSGIAVGPGRGSVSGSLVAYTLGITDADPIEHDIIMERFVSEVRTDMPDIDMDFQDNRREDVIRHLAEVYGQDNVVRLGTEIRSKGRLVLRDVGRALGISREEIDPVAASVIYRSGGDARANYTIEDSFSQFDVCKRFDKRYPKVRKSAIGLEGRIRNYGCHASGVLVTPWPTTEWIPLERRGDLITTAWTMDDLAYLGLLKLDILGITGLSIVATCLDLIEQRTGNRLNLGVLPLDDQETLAAFPRRETVGIFQFGSLGLRRLCERLAKAKGGTLVFDDLAVLNTLHRPAMLNIGLHQEYIYRVMGTRPVTFDHPVMEKHLGKTYGIAMYQEQIMMICRDLGGLSWAHVGLIRKIISKKQGVELFSKARTPFVEGAVKNGCDREVATRIFNSISHAGSYAFNHAHAVGYSLLAYRQMYLKTHYPLEYHAALLICENSTELKPEYIRSARRAGITVTTPDINGSGIGYTIDGELIRCGLADVDGVGVAAATAIAKEQPFKNVADFVLRVDRRLVHKRVTERLIMAGAFRSLHTNTKALLDGWKEITNEAIKDGLARKSRGRQRTLLGDVAFVSNIHDKMKALALEPEWSEAEEEKAMRTVLQFPSDEHPFEAYSDITNRIDSACGLTPLSEVDFDKGHDSVLVAGIVTRHNWKIEGLEGGAYRDGTGDMEGHKYVHLNIEDGTDFLMAHFDKTMYRKHKQVLERPDGYPIVCEGLIRPGMSKVYVANFTLLNDWGRKVNEGEALTPFERRLMSHPMKGLMGSKMNNVKRLWQLGALWPLGLKVRVLALPAWVREGRKVWTVLLQDVTKNGPVNLQVLVWPDAASQYGEQLKSPVPLFVELMPMRDEGRWSISARHGCKVEYAQFVELEEVSE